jgi:hypothetical protein
MIYHYGGTSHAVFTTLIKSLFSSNLEPYETQYSFINRIRQLVASIQTIGDKRITVSTHIETLTLRLSSVAFTLIMTSPCFITPTVVVLLEKKGVTKPDVPNDCDWYVCRGNGK